MSRSLLRCTPLTMLLVTFVLACAAPALAAVPYVAETPIATGPSNQDATQIGQNWLPGARAVWEDDASGDWDLGFYEWWPLSLSLGASQQRHPATWLRTAVYEDDRATDWDIYASMAETVYASPSPSPSFSESPVATGAGDQLDPAIDAGHVVFEDTAAGNSDIAAVDLDTGIRRVVTANKAAQADPAIEGDSVVYSDRRNGNWDIYLKNLKTGREKRLTTSKADQTAPQIGNGIVVYQDDRNGNWDIYAYVLKTGVERRITGSKADQTAPWIDRAGHGAVVYQDHRDGNDNIYLYDFRARVEKRLTDDPAAQTAPSIYKDKVVWTDARAGNADIYLGTLDFPTLHLGGPGSPPGYNSTVTFHGTLSGFPGVKLTKSGAGGTKTITTGDLGNFSFSVPRVQRKITVRCAFRGDATHLPANTVTVTVKPKALLTRPGLVKPPVEPGHFPIFGRYICNGFLKPHHAAGSKAVIVKVYGKSSVTGDWVLRDTVAAKIRNYGTHSAYTVNVSLGIGYPYSHWKVQAVHSDKDHAQTLSPFSAIK